MDKVEIVQSDVDAEFLPGLPRGPGRDRLVRLEMTGRQMIQAVGKAVFLRKPSRTLDPSLRIR
jgi:hypothetical protein